MGVPYNDRLEWLKELAPDILDKPKERSSEDEETVKTIDNESEEHLQTAKDKIQEMIDRLTNQEFTRYWP